MLLFLIERTTLNTLYLFILLAVLQIADVGSTAYAIKRGIGHEANPVMVWLIDQLGLVIGLLLPKIVMLLLLYFYALTYPLFAAYVLGAMSVLYAVVVFKNTGFIYYAITKRHHS